MGTRFPSLAVFLSSRPFDICSSNLLVTTWLGAGTGCANFLATFLRDLSCLTFPLLVHAVCAVVEVLRLVQIDDCASEACARQVPDFASPLWLRERSKRIPGPLLVPIAVSPVVLSQLSTWNFMESWDSQGSAGFLLYPSMPSDL